MHTEFILAGASPTDVISEELFDVQPSYIDIDGQVVTLGGLTFEQSKPLLEYLQKVQHCKIGVVLEEIN